MRKAIQFSSNTVFHLLHKVLLLALNPPTDYKNLWSTERSQGKIHNTLFSVLFFISLTRKVLKQHAQLRDSILLLTSELSYKFRSIYHLLNCFTLLFKTSPYPSAEFTAYSSTQTFIFLHNCPMKCNIKTPCKCKVKNAFPNVICKPKLIIRWIISITTLQNVVMLITDKNNDSSCLYQTLMHLRSSTSHAETTATFNVQ